VLVGVLIGAASLKLAVVVAGVVVAKFTLPNNPSHNNKRLAFVPHMVHNHLANQFFHAKTSLLISLTQPIRGRSDRENTLLGL
jgi:hypothetical protein